MKKNNNLLIILFLVTTLNGQDKLITLSGIEYSGKYVGQTNDKIEFIQAGKTNSVLVPKESVQAIILENLKIVDIQLVQVSNENQIAIDKDDKHKDGMPTLNANDKLTTISGKVYLGKFISVENDKVKFIQGGFAFPSFIPDHTVRSIVLSDGTVVYGKGASGQDDTDSVSDVMAISSGYNPCEDERYIQIKSKPLDDMSDREYNYFISINKECKEYQSKAQVSTPRPAARSPISSNQIGSIPTENRTDVEYEDYTIYLKKLGCKLGQAIGKETGVYYYKDQTKNFDLWIKIEDDDHWAYLESLGYRKGETINKPKGGLYIYKGGSWKKFVPAKPEKYIRGITDVSSQQAPTFYINVGYDMLGNYLLDYDGEEYDDLVVNSQNIGAELLFFKSGAVGIGFGGEYQFPRKLDVDDAVGEFFFTPVYGFVMYSDPNSPQAYGTVKFGFSPLNGDNDFKGDFELEGGNYLSYGGGYNFTNGNIIFLWSLCQGKATYKYGGDVYTAEIQYDKFSIGLSLNLNSIQN